MVILLLTLFTQTGGIILLLCLPSFSIINHHIKNNIIRFVIKSTSFALVYILISFAVVPIIAAKFGRVPLPVKVNDANAIQPLNILTYLLNRHYLRPQLKETAIRVSDQLNKTYPGSVVCYLDANFPFANGFPLIPHLSHNDGKKLDLAFFYKDAKTGEEINRNVPSGIGYGICELARPGEVNMPLMCEKQGYWQYSFLQKIVPQQAKDKMVFDEKRTKKLLQLLTKNRSIGKIFLEPHLKQRMGLQTYTKIRFHGCQAVRHDDHIHIQLH